MISGSPVFDDQGLFVRVVSTEQDITEVDLLRRQLEEQTAIRDHFRHQMLEMQLSSLDAQPIVALLAYPYPGNIRELVNICERLAVMIDGPEIQVADLPGDVQGERPWHGPAFPEGAMGEITLSAILNDTERRVLIEARERFGTQEKIARALVGVNQSTIARKLRRCALGGSA